MAETPWGELPVADAHMHFFSRRFYEALATQKKLPRAEDLTALLEWDIPAEDPAQLATRWSEQLDVNGVSRAALIASIPEDEESVEAAVSAYPDRFFGYFMVDPLRPQTLERLKAVLGRGVLEEDYVCSPRCMDIRLRIRGCCQCSNLRPTAAPSCSYIAVSSVLACVSGWDFPVPLTCGIQGRWISSPSRCTSRRYDL